MDKIIITGNGPLHGEVRVAGAKNAALPIIAASLLSAQPLHIGNIPGVRDIDTALKLLTLLGCQAERSGTDLSLDTSKVHSVYAPYELVKTMRGAILLLGPLLARFGEADVSLPGGCAIGSRPVNEHITGLQALGAEITIEAGYIKAKAKRLRGAHFTFDIPSVTATENLLMAASLAEGTTVLENCAMEPEVGDLARLLVSMGAKIQGAGTSTISIEGVDSLGGTHHRRPPGAVSGYWIRTRIFSTTCWASWNRREPESSWAPTGFTSTPPASAVGRCISTPHPTRHSPPICRPSSWR